MADKKPTTKKNGEPRKPAAPQIDAETFVRTWQACASIEEAQAKLGEGAGNRARLYRKKGVALKEMPGARGRSLNVAALNAIIGVASTPQPAAK